MQVAWEESSADIVLEASGKFLTRYFDHPSAPSNITSKNQTPFLNGELRCRKALDPYFQHGIKKVVVAAPVKDADPVLNVVMGCNEVLLPKA